MGGTGTRDLRALIVGVDHYPRLSERRQLRGCVNDALALRELFVGRLEVSPERITLALSAAPGREVLPHRPATAVALREAFAELAADAREGEEVIVFFAGHGMRLSRATTGEYAASFAPADTALDSADFAALILGRELHRLCRTLVERGARPTLIVDACHSGGSVRAFGVGAVRALVTEAGEPEWRLGEEAWGVLAAAHPAQLGTRSAPSFAAGEQGGPGGRGLGWLGAEAARDWVMLAACRDVEVAREHWWMSASGGMEPRGVMTSCLLHEIARVPDGVLSQLRWCDVMPSLRRAVRLRADQRPVLEGREEHPVFGGAWEPGRAGIAVTVGAEPGLFELAAGQLHGFEEGADVEIGGARACIERASPASSVARLAPETEIVLGADARAVLVAPGRSTVRTRALVPAGIPAPELPRPEPLLVIVGEGPADVEVRPWPRGGWVLVPYDAAAREATPDDVIAYVRTAAGLGAGLAHWARYRAVRDRANADPALLGLVEVRLRVGDTAESSVLRVPEPDGIHRVLEDEPLWLEVCVRRQPEGRLFVGLLLCSDDGNVHALWPPPGGDPTVGGRGESERKLPAGQTLYLGADPHTPALPEIRRDQQVSRYTFKVVACTLPGRDASPPSLSTLAIAKTVQQVTDDAAAGTGKDPDWNDEAFSPSRTEARWCTWDISMAVARR